MPTRHAKNNTALGWFTSGERKKLSKLYGSRKERVGADSVKDFDACSLCLKQATQPVACSKGHLFCRECIVKNLLEQKQEVKLKKALYEKQLLEKQAEAEEKQRDVLTEELAKFDKAESAVLPQQAALSMPASSSSSSQESEQPSKTRKQRVGDDVSAERRTATGIVDAHDKELPCFWIPQLIPDNHKRDITKPDTKTYCPGGPTAICGKSESKPDASSSSSSSSSNKKRKRSAMGRHHLRMKDMITVNFAEVEQETSVDKTKTKFDRGRYMCPSCRKILKNSTRSILFGKCGHVYCEHCVKKFVAKSRQCMRCSKSIKDKDFIPLEVGGTGFASHGAQVEATKVRIAYQ